MERKLNRLLRDLMTHGAGLLIPGAADALAARVIHSVGFQALLVTGAGVANSYLGVPDIGLVTLKEFVDHVWAIRDAVDIPIIADADTGFGNAVNVGRTIRLLERAGSNAIAIEDQVFPKKCGHFEGKNVISAQEMIQKIKAAVDARCEPEMMILARTDARAVEGLDAALERAAKYREAGADILFVEAPQTAKELAAVPRQVPGIHLCNMVVGGKTPLLAREELAAMGYAGIAYANTALQASVLAMRDVLGLLKEKGTMLGLEGKVMSFEDRQKLVDHPRYQALQKRYAEP